MSQSFRRYRIEGQREFAPAGVVVGDSRLDEILATLHEVKRVIDPLQRPGRESAEHFRQELMGTAKLRTELDIMKSAILAMKQEVGSLRYAETKGEGLRRVVGELDAVVSATAGAATTILSAVETIETQAMALRSGTAADASAHAVIQDQIVLLYEACNFQDLTGQRITKIVSVMKFVEERIDRMIGLWTRLDALKDAEGASPEPLPPDRGLLHGPKLEGDLDHVSQRDIDGLFGP